MKMQRYRHRSVARRVRGRLAHGPAGFTLIELLIVVVVLGVLSALVVPQFADATEQTSETSVSRQLQMLRGQIELYRNQEGRDPDLIGNQWADLVTNDYLVSEPFNPGNRSSLIAGAPGAGVGWVWRDKGNGTMALYATDVTMAVELPE